MTSKRCMDQRENSQMQKSIKVAGTAIALLSVKARDRVMYNLFSDVKPASSRGLPGITLREFTSVITMPCPNCDVALPGLGSGQMR
jgi:hypothetical protein